MFALLGLLSFVWDVTVRVRFTHNGFESLFSTLIFLFFDLTLLSILELIIEMFDILNVQKIMRKEYENIVV